MWAGNQNISRKRLKRTKLLRSGRRESWGRSSDYKLLALGFSFGEIAGYQNRLSVWRLSCEEKMLKRKLHAL
jgi:hypothetical protein